MSVRFFSFRFFDSFRVSFSFFSFAWATHNTTWASSYGKWKKHQLKMDWIAGGWKEKRAQHKSVFFYCRQVDGGGWTDGRTSKQKLSIIKEGAWRAKKTRTEWKQINGSRNVHLITCEARASGRYVGLCETLHRCFSFYDVIPAGSVTRYCGSLNFFFIALEGWPATLAKPWSFLVFFSSSFLHHLPHIIKIQITLLIFFSVAHV